MNNAAKRLVLTIMAMSMAAMAVLAMMWRTGANAPAIQQTAPQQSASATSMPMQGDAAAPLMEAMQKMQENPNDIEAMMNAARILQGQDKLEAALSLARRAAISAPSDPRPPHMAGVILAGQKKWDEAVQELERSLSIKDNSSARYSLAVIYRYHLRQEDKAKVHFDMAARLCEDPALATMINAELGK